MLLETIAQAATNHIWGEEDANDRLDRLPKFFERCRHQMFLLCEKELETSILEEKITGAIDSIKKNPSTTKSGIAELCGSSLAVLDCAVRIMLMTACQTEFTALGSFLTFRWRNEETIQGFLNRVYPRMLAGERQDQAVNIRNARAHMLVKHAGIKFQETDNLSDHLYLIYGDGFKTLLVFTHRSALEYSLEKLRPHRNDLDHSTAEALALGCLPPQLILETLRTLDLLFPSLGDKRSRKILQRWVDNNKLDKCLLDRSGGFSTDLQPPKDFRGLYEQYPYWGRQLARLLREVDDPTPTTRWERITERGRSPRQMYKCALAALVVAALSALLATVLAAVQLWVAYCGWDGAPSRSYCPAKNEVGEKDKGI